MKTSVFPSGENRGRKSLSPVVICSARPPLMGTRQSRVLYSPSSIVRRP